jgi:hypothetical protein
MTVTVDVELVAGWGFRNRLHGGYLLAQAVGAALTQAPPAHPHPVAVQAVYAAPPVPGPATVEVTPLRFGRTVSTFRAVLVQERPMVEVLVTAALLPSLESEPAWSAGEDMPALADPEDCLGGSRDTSGAGRSGFAGHIVTRLDTSWAPPPYGPGGRADLRGWVSCDYPDPVLGALVLADAMPPVTFDLGRTGWMPTLQLQVLLRRVPPAGWLAARQWGLLLAGGLLDEDCTLWSPGGTLIAQARQLVAVRA